MTLGSDANEEAMRIARGGQSLQSEQIAAETREGREPDAHGPWLTNRHYHVAMSWGVCWRPVPRKSGGTRRGGLGIGAQGAGTLGQK